MRNNWKTLPSQIDFQDVIQQVHVNLAETIGSDYLDRIEEALNGRDFKSSSLNQEIKRSVWNAVAFFSSKSARRKANHVSLDRLGVELASPMPTSDAVDLVERALDLTSALDRLSQKEKHVWDLTYREGMTLRQIGQKLGISHQAADRIQDRVFTKLGDALRSYK